MTACRWLILVAGVVLVSSPVLRAADADPQTLVFSLKSWEGEYTTSDAPGAPPPTPVTGAIYTIRGDGAELTKVAQPGKSADYPFFSPDGKWIYFQSNASGTMRIYRRPAGEGELQVVGDATRLGPPWTTAYGYSLSRDGTRLLYSVSDGSQARIAMANSDGSDPRLILPELGYLYMVSLAPANDVLVCSGPASGYRLKLIHLADKKVVDLTPDHPDSYAPQFTPDGRTLIFLRRDGDIYRVDVDGKNLRRLTEGNRYVEFRLSPRDAHGSTDAPQLSPDGRKIAYIALRQGVPNVGVIDLDGSEPKQITYRNVPCGRVRWSPDGKRLAFVSFDGKYPQLFVVSATGGEPQQLTRLDGAVYFVQWKPVP
ncbi:MAG TPA: hypothetical protein VL475_06640 [Planctomycetaceae bacterium]|nr:hypothetical protein [Planctomycetaceae bacterium]